MFLTDVLNYFSWDYFFQEKGYTSGEMIIEEFCQYQPSKTLIEEAQKIIKDLGFAPLEVRFEETKSGFDAEQDRHIIRIKPNLPPSAQRECFVFELTNLIQHKKHTAIWNAAKAGMYKTSDEYARAVEFLEYYGDLQCKTISHVINNEKGRIFRPYINSKYKFVPIESMGFNLFYRLLVEENHKEYYRNAWQKLNSALTHDI